MSTPSLDDLLTVPVDADTVWNQEVLPVLRDRRTRVTDWLVGGAYRAAGYIIATMRLNVRLAIAIMTAANYEDYVFGVATPPTNPDGSVNDVTGYAPYVALQRYGIKQIEASYTRRRITLTNAVATPYGPIQKGDFMIVFPSGNRYVNDEEMTIPASDSIEALFRSELTTDSAKGIVYNDGSDETIALVTASYPGVTATNPAPDFSEVGQSGASLGTVTPGGSPTGEHTVFVRIDNPGDVADDSVGWSTNVDNEGWVPQTGSTATNLGGYGINVTLADAGGSPNFARGVEYYFNTPGSDITQVGADAETPQQIGARVRGIWPSLAFTKDDQGNVLPASPTMNAYEALARSSNEQVRVVTIQPDRYVNNRLDIVCAGQGGAPLSPGTVTNIQQFFDAFRMITDKPFARTSVARTIELAGLSIDVPAGLRASAQASMTQRLQIYFGGSDPGAALSINGFIDYDYIISLVRTTPGVKRVRGTLTINDEAIDLQLPVTPGAFESARWNQTSDEAFAWNPV